MIKLLILTAFVLCFFLPWFSLQNNSISPFTDSLKLNTSAIQIQDKKQNNGENSGLEISYEELNEDRFFAYIFIGLSLGFALINILLFFNSKDKIYLYYTLFIILQSIYYFRLTTAHWSYWLNYLPEFHKALTSIIQFIINLSYLIFIKTFLKMDIYYPYLNKAVKVTIYFLIVLALMDAIFLSINPDFQYQSLILNAHRLIMTLFSIAGIIYLFLYKKSNYVYFIIIATILFITGALTTLFSGEIKYMIIGGFLECSVFAAGLAYRIKKTNEHIIKIEKEAVLLGKTALTAQLNPHFIFNALSSIQYLMSNNDKKNAIRYLNEFSLLIRQILESSFELNIPLYKEIELLKRYVEIESLRFNKNFSYEFYVDETIDQYNQEIPVFLIQPYIENSIIHGLMPKNGDAKQLKISFVDGDDYIKCIISDNGIGRFKAKQTTNHITHKSHGLSLAQKRIDMINKKNGLKTAIEYEDSDKGTIVNINIVKC